MCDLLLAKEDVKTQMYSSVLPMQLKLMRVCFFSFECHEWRLQELITLHNAKHITAQQIDPAPIPFFTRSYRICRAQEVNRAASTWAPYKIDINFC